MEVTFEQASNNTVDVEFVVRLSPLALPAPEHRLAFHPQLPFHLRSLSEKENLRSYSAYFCITSRLKNLFFMNIEQDYFLKTPC